MKISTRLGLMPLLLLLGACSEVKNLHEMHDSTVAMNDKMSGMSQRTETLTEYTTELAEGMSQGIPAMVREHALNMVQAESMGQKFFWAGMYVKGQQYQVWPGLKGMNPQDRERQAADAMTEFFYLVKGLALSNLESDPMAYPSTLGFKNRRMTLNALSAAISLVNDRQVLLLRAHPELKEITMYSMIRDALLADAEIARDPSSVKKYPLYVKEVLKFREYARFLARVRYNFLPVLALSSATHNADDLAGFFKTGLHVLRSWELDLSRLSAMEIDEINRYMDAAVKTGELLKTADILPDTSSLVTSMLANMNVKIAAPAGLPTATAHTMSQNRFVALTSAYRQQLEDFQKRADVSSSFEKDTQNLQYLDVGP